MTTPYIELENRTTHLNVNPGSGALFYIVNGVPYLRDSDGIFALTPAPIVAGSLTPIAGSFTSISGVVTDATLNAPVVVQTLDHEVSTGTPTSGVGGSIALKEQSATVVSRLAAAIDWYLSTATDASRIGDLSLNVYNIGTKQEALHVRGHATKPQIGFLGASPITPATFTQTYATADPTLGAYTSNPQSSAYATTGATTDIASKAELNLLRVAYENLRAFTEDLAAFVNAKVDDDQLLGLAN